MYRLALVLPYIWGFMAYLKIIMQILPDLIDLIKWTKSAIEEGMTLAEIKARFKSVTKALDNTNRPQSARQLNDVFRGKP
jgi:hypothetical protein